MGDLVKRGRGRPPVTMRPFSDEIAQAICNRLAEGESLRSICETDGFPCGITVMNWTQRDPEFGLAYARARELQAEHFVDELMDIADDGRNDFMMRAMRNGETFLAADHEHLKRSEIRIGTRQWIIERILANKYGPKPQVVAPSAPVTVNIATNTVELSQGYMQIISGDE
jgi:hypothetical protein